MLKWVFAHATLLFGGATSVGSGLFSFVTGTSLTAAVSSLISVAVISAIIVLAFSLFLPRELRNSLRRGAWRLSVAVTKVSLRLLGRAAQEVVYLVHGRPKRTNRTRKNKELR